MQNIPKQKYIIEFKERAIKHAKEGKSIGLSVKKLGLVKQTLRNWMKLSAAGKLTGAGIVPLGFKAMV
jgi:transposase-like protein